MKYGNNSIVLHTSAKGVAQFPLLLFCSWNWNWSVRNSSSIWFLPATWKLYGDAIWWALCATFDVTIFYLLWVNIQWILLCSLSHIWCLCLQMPR